MSQDRDAMRVEADGLRQLLASFQGIRERDDADRGKALVSLRRDLSARVTAIAAIVRPLLQRTGDAQADADFRRVHSTMMTRMASHQASWPAVLLLRGGNDEEYTRSARMVDEAGQALVAFLEHAALNR